MTDILIFTLIYAAYLLFAAKRLLTYTHAFQQEEYDELRFIKWILQHKVFDKRLSLALIVIAAASLFLAKFVVGFALFAAFIFTAYKESDPRKNAKKKLALTNRVKRTIIPAYIALAFLGVACLIAPVWSWIICVHLIPLILIISNLILMQFERRIQSNFLEEAKDKITDLNPKIIAITGSFGKTSVKHILGHILKTQAPSLITPGSVNTPMGITRIIRENLNETHKYFVVEMGAYGPGSIARLCDLTPPDMGIISAIGHAHYERFKSLETVAETKFELAEAVLDKKGSVIIHERILRFEHSRNIKEKSPESFIVCGEPIGHNIYKKKEEHYLSEGDLTIQEVVQNEKGLEVNLSWKGELYHLRAPLYGIHHGHNIALAFATAIELGVAAEDIQTALISTPQIPHRLEVKKQNDGTTIIDDAYNSNPVGFGSALDLLATLGKGTRKILITPGMVELGGAHNQAHNTAGKQAGSICDVALIVQPERIKTFIEGFKATGGDKTLIEVGSFQEAAQWLSENKQQGDVVLLENDLPDIYERIPQL